MGKVPHIVITLLVVLLMASPLRGALKIGDKAPPLTVTDWIKGRPFNIATDGNGKVIVLEFWATWCPPCIQLIPQTNEFYQRYKDKGLLLAAITDPDRGQQLKAVQEFVARQGKRMDYPVAYDRTQRTAAAYVLGTGAFGIPHSVVIDKGGRLAWFGHPASPEMEQIVRDLLMDRYDPAKREASVAREARLEPLRRSFDQAVMRGDWNGCLSITEAMLDVDGADFDAIRWTILIYLEELRSVSDMRKWVRSFIRERSDNAQALSQVALLMLAMPDMPDRQPDLAIEAARLAYQADSSSADIIQAVAQVHFQIGNIDAAVEFQRRAVAAANMLDVEAARAILKFYETCRSLQAKEKEKG